MQAVKETVQSSFNPPSENTPFVTVEPKWDPKETMLALTFQGKEHVQVKRVPKPLLTDPTDALVRVTSATVCGSDLHLYHNEIPDMRKDDILGHEFMGIVDDVGPEVTKVKKGDRVLASFNVACGKCDYCKRQEYTACDTTNPSSLMERMYGHRCAGMFGYSHMTGGYPGGQCEFVRVPFADVNCCIVPEDLADEQVLFLTDAAATAYLANVLGEVKEGDRVAIWGAGPIGLMAAKWAFTAFKAAEVVIIDNVPSRLMFARSEITDDKSKIHTINFDEHDVIPTIQKLFPGGPDVAIDAAGFRYAKSMGQRVQRGLFMETDSCDVVTECITCVRKFGHVSLIADYVGYVNRFPIGALMEKGLTVRGSQTPVQKYWHQLLDYIKTNQIDLRFIISHVLPLSKAAEVYSVFDKKEEGMIKTVLKTDFGMQMEQGTSQRMGKKEGKVHLGKEE